MTLLHSLGTTLLLGIAIIATPIAMGVGAIEIPTGLFITAVAACAALVGVGTTPE